MKKNNYFFDILIFAGLVICLILLNGCNPTADTSVKALGKADLRDLIDFSSATINVNVPITLKISDVRGISISSPTINVNVRALENYKYPLIAQLDIFRNQSNSSWLTYVILVILLLNFTVLVIHLKRIK